MEFSVGQTKYIWSIFGVLKVIFFLISFFLEVRVAASCPISDIGPWVPKFDSCYSISAKIIYKPFHRVTR